MGKNPTNENASVDRGARQSIPVKSNAPPPQFGKPEEKCWEDRPNWASCFPPRNPKTDHPPDFTGITVIDGKKYWVNVYKKLDRNGNRYVSVNVRPFGAERR
jgi:hypothetical protein